MLGIKGLSPAEINNETFNFEDIFLLYEYQNEGGKIFTYQNLSKFIKI